MTRTILTLILCAILLPAQAVVLIGHRGSSEGVENTLAAYSAGADRGYYGLETDLHITKDGYFVCSHDARLTEWSHPKVVIEKTKLADLQKLQLVQTRWGNIVEGKITTFEEYLDLCIERNVVPVIELKSTTGINSKDTFNMPLLLQIVKKKGLLYKAVFICFSQAPLQYIRNNEPREVQVQFLCMPHNEYLYFNWMKENHIDLDICRGFPREMVEKYHAAGLKVNCWTIDDPVYANLMVDYGVDMITTNKVLYSDLNLNRRTPLQPKEGASRVDTAVCHLGIGQDSVGVCVYLPAGYDSEPAAYPVLYLLHGSGDEETGWQWRGNIVQIMDSMIANGLCKPMVVVMPNGFLETYTQTQHLDSFPDIKAKHQYGDGRFENAFSKIMTWAELYYHIRSDKQHRAIAGLSMGGMHTFHISHLLPHDFDYVGLFSSVIIPHKEETSLTVLNQLPQPVYAQALQQLDEQFVHAPKLYWIACGKDDFLYEDNVSLRHYLNLKGYPYLYHESAGGHSWKNWQDYITQLLPMLF